MYQEVITILVLTDIHAQHLHHVDLIRNMVKDRDVDAVVLNGDNVNGKEWRLLHKQLEGVFVKTPLLVTWGNHDGNDAVMANRQALYNTHSERTSKTLGGVSLVGLDSGGGWRVMDMRRSWWPWNVRSRYRGIRSHVLDKPFQNCSLVFTHIIPREVENMIKENRYIAKGHWPNTVTPDCGDTDVLTKLWKSGVRHVFTGHNHCNLGTLIPKKELF